MNSISHSKMFKTQLQKLANGKTAEVKEDEYVRDSQDVADIEEGGGEGNSEEGWGEDSVEGCLGGYETGIFHKIQKQLNTHFIYL